MNKVLIVEDHALIRFGLKTAFENKDFISEIYEAACAEDAFDIVKKNDIDVVIMDLGLPTLNGIEATKVIKDLKKDIKIIILTSHSSEQEVIDSLKAGARAYCSKDINPERLADILLTVTEGALWFDSKVSEIVISTISDSKSSSNKIAFEEYNLTDREIEVLNYICSGFTNGEISKELDVSINTIKVHVSSIIQKMGVEDRTQVVVKAFGNYRKINS